MSYRIDETKIVDWAKKQLPDVNTFDKNIVVVYVNDFFGETQVIRENRFIEIDLLNGKTLIFDKKEKSYYYYVCFKKSNTPALYWDLVGFDKSEIIIMEWKN
jgi:hypothetical protein